MGKKSKVVIAILIAIIIKLYFFPKEKDEIIGSPDPHLSDDAVYEKTTYKHSSGISIGVVSISSSNASCNINYPDNKKEHHYWRVGQRKSFMDLKNKGYYVELNALGENKEGKKYAVFKVYEDNSIARNENIEKENKIKEAEDKEKRYNDAIKAFEDRIEEKVNDQFLSSNEKIRLDIEYRNNWDESKTFKCEVLRIEQYREKEKEIPNGYSRYDFSLTYFFKITVQIPNGTETYRTNYTINVKDDKGVVQIEKPFYLTFKKG